MDSSILISVLSLLATLIQTVVAWLSWKNPSADHSPKRNDEGKMKSPLPTIIGIALTACIAVGAALWTNFQGPPHFKHVPEDQLQLIENKQFINEAVDLDGKHFEHCRFYDVTLHLKGERNFSLTEKNFSGVIRLTYTTDAAMQASDAVVDLLNMSEMIANGRVGFVGPHDSIVIMKDSGNRQGSPPYDHHSQGAPTTQVR